MHRAKECKAPPKCLTCTHRGEMDIANVSGSGSCPVFREELQRLRGSKWSSCSSTSGEERMPRTSWCRLPGRGGPMSCSLVSNTNGRKTLLGIRMHHGDVGSLFVALVWAQEIFWSPMQGSFGWRWRVCVCTAATSLPASLSRSSRPRSSSSRKASERLVGGPLLRASSIVSRSSGKKPVPTAGIAAPCLASRIGDWCVLEVITLSDLEWSSSI